jgi:molecular chaperone GrpE
MKRGLLDNWLWKGTFEDEVAPLEVVDIVESRDVTSLFASHLAEVTRQVETLEEALKRERSLVAQRSGHGDFSQSTTDGGEEELKRHAKSMLPAMDALDRLIEFSHTMDSSDEIFKNWIGCVEALRLRLTKTLEGIGLTAISSVGMEVDLNVHDVVAVVPAGEFPSNTVVTEQQRGYYFRGRLLRDARVIVAQ